MRIVHLSDLHIGYKDCAERFGEIIKNMKLFFPDNKKPIIVITGDIVNKGKDKNQLDTAKKLIIKLEEEFTVLLVPGNHDYGSGSRQKDKYGMRFCELFYGVQGVEFPILGNPKSPGLLNGVAFVGLDSMEQELEERDYWFGAQGRIGDEQLGKLDNLLKEMRETDDCKKVVVYFHHHPFKQRSNHGLHDVEKLYNVLSKNRNIDCLLFGHNHNGLSWNDSWGIERCYDAGTATLKDGQTGHHRIIDLGLDPIFDSDGDFHGSNVVSEP